MSLEKWYGPQTELAVANFPISGRPLDQRVIRALAEVKAACARVNDSTGVLTHDIALAIEIAAVAVARGAHDDQFPVDTYQTGSGTSSNMNVNEVVAALASSASGISIHPNDHVNASQSSNDVFPTAVHLAAARVLIDTLLPELAALAASLERRASEHADTIKAGRTHLMDAVPVTFGQELGGYAAQIRRSIERLCDALPRLCEVPLGGSAVGTGLNTPDAFRARAVDQLARASGIPLTPARDAFEAQSVRDAWVETSGALRTLAVSMTKICNDLRWLSSGPTTGLAEITLPELQAGSSIMPGKVNPVIPEAVLQVCARVVGNDATIAWAGASGNFELTAAMPVMADALLESLTLLGHGCALLRERCIDGLVANTDRMAAYASGSPAAVTALNDVLGYERGAALVKQAAAAGKPVMEFIDDMIDAGELAATAREALDPLRAARPGPKEDN